jgi:hypothetical protein
MKSRFRLPEKLAAGASINGNEYGWPLSLFPEIATRAEAMGYACLGGQFQFRTPIGVCEMYWLSADSSDRRPEENWDSYCGRTREEVLEKFSNIVSETDFMRVAADWPVLKLEIERGIDILATLVFAADFVTEKGWSHLR